MTITTNGEQFVDTEHECQDCRRTFTFTTGEAAFFAEKGFTVPKRCKPCRQANKHEKERRKMERASAGQVDQPESGRRSRRQRGHRD